PARPVDAGGLRRRRPAGGAATDRPLVRRGAPARGRRALPAGHRLAPATPRRRRMIPSSRRGNGVRLHLLMESDPISPIAPRALACLAVALVAGCGVVGGGGGTSGRAPIADQRIELAGRCNQVDVDGFGENAVL